ncbi:RNA polymerase II C-terminal domain phosphatase-like 1-like protein, partial [Drosera capensis]
MILVYQGEDLVGEVDLYLNHDDTMMMMMVDGIKIERFSQPSERCPPLAVLHTIANDGVWFRMESRPQVAVGISPLSELHSSCFRDNKTAVMALGEDELHLVAMPSRKSDPRISCFWGFKVTKGLYDSSLVMLNLRCLGIVFDLDETLVVAYTLKSFEDRMEGVRRKMGSETDPARRAGMQAEIRRYQEDRAMLKQFADNDQIVDNGEMIEAQSEIVLALSDNHPTVIRPIIRLQEKNIILTRINPQNRDTSVLVRIRPAWEDLRSYLTARGRKRFEVFVCTLAERDYALEMWRLLDPDANLINTSELLDRIACVKHGAKKSLLNVFNDGSCHPRMSLVIDDRLVVWDEKDQLRVHIVPQFAPYYTPEAEANVENPVMHVVRTVACNVRTGFFREFDDNLLQQISKVSYEDDLKNFPPPPDVSSYCKSEEPITASSEVPPVAVASMTSFDPRLVASFQVPVTAVSPPIPQPASAPIMPFSTNQLQATTLVRQLGPAGPMDPSLQISSSREEGEVPESELDPDTRRRLLILHHGLDIREHPPVEPPFPVRPPIQPPVQAPIPVPVPVSVPVPVPIPGSGPRPRMEPCGRWFPGEDQINPGRLGRQMGHEYPLPTDGVHFGKMRPPPPSPPPPAFQRRMESPIPPERPFLPRQRFSREVPRREDRWRPNHMFNHQPFPGEDASSRRFSSSSKDFTIESGRPSSRSRDSDSDPDPPSSRNRSSETAPAEGFPYSDSRAGALHDIAMKCGTQVEFRPSLVATRELKFRIQVYFAGEIVGEGIGRTRREAQHQAAEASLIHLAG